jgi:hypothetical protein
LVKKQGSPNFYTLLENNIEYNSRDNGGNIFGYRAQLIYPPSEEHLFLGELPLLYNDQSEKFGLGDIRLRYFWLPYKDYEKFLGAFGPSVDIFAPTGNFEDGLGSSSWVITPGVMAALMFEEWIQAFVVLSYQYTSKPTTDLIPEDQKKDRSGITIQSITPVVFSEDFFIQFTPAYAINDLDDSSSGRYIQELLAQYAVSPTVQISAFWRGIFKDNDHTIRAGVVLFL